MENKAQESYMRLQELLDKKGITAYKLAKETGVTTATLTSWKQGKYIPKNEKINKIADYLCVRAEYIIDGIESTDMQETNIKVGEYLKSILVSDAKMNFLELLVEIPDSEMRGIEDFARYRLEKYAEEISKEMKNIKNKKGK